MTPHQRIAANVIPDGDCQIWQGTLIGGNTGKNYATFRVDGKRWLIHRWLYTTLVGPIPDGLTIDHTCRNTRCLNIAHLEAVTRSENTKRHYRAQTACKKGHPYTDGAYYTYVYNGYQRRYCKECMRINRAERHSNLPA